MYAAVKEDKGQIDTQESKHPSKEKKEKAGGVSSAAKDAGFCESAEEQTSWLEAFLTKKRPRPAFLRFYLEN